MKHSKLIHPIFEQILTEFIQQEPAELQVELQALPTAKEIYFERHESREELGILHSDYTEGDWF